MRRGLYPGCGVVRRAIAGVLAALLLTGCLSVRSNTVPAHPGAGGGVSLTVYPDSSARRAGYAGPAGISSELVRREGGHWEPVFRSLHPVWTVTGLPVGSYRVRFPARLDEHGHVVRLDEETRTFRVRDGEVAEIEATLKHVSTPLVVAGVAAGVVAAVLLHEWLKKHDLPAPPLPPPPPWWLVDVAVHLVIELSLAPRYYEGGPWTPAPVVSGHHPAHRATVEGGDLRIVFSMAQPLSARLIEGGGVSVLGEHSGLVPGFLQYDAEEWWLVWEPDLPLPGGDTFHVTLAADAFEDIEGRGLEGPVSFTFHTW